MLGGEVDSCPMLKDGCEVQTPERHNEGVEISPPEGLTGEQREWALHSEALWARAHRIAQQHPQIDAGDVYHALRCLELPPAERLRYGLSRGRLRAYAR